MPQSVTKEHIASLIREIEYIRPKTAPTLTICVMNLENGFSVRGESACADPAMFNAELGRKLAYEDAFRKVWALEGYLLRQRMYEESDRLDRIARTCHEVNRAYCAAIGDNSHVAWDEAPDWQKISAVAGATGAIANPEATPADMHGFWMADKRADGWVYGPVKDPEAKTHPCMVPYDQLPPEQRAKDALFLAVVRAMTA